MKKVICVANNIPNEIMLKPVIGSTYEVEQSDYRPDYWSIASLLCPGSSIPGQYHKKYFAESSDIEETDLLEERLTKEDRLLKAFAELCPEAKLSKESEKRIWKGVQKHINGTK